MMAVPLIVESCQYIICRIGVSLYLFFYLGFTINLSVKRFINFWFYCATWMLLSYLFSYAIGNNKWDVVSLLQCLLPISKTTLWFVPFYFWLMLLSPLINAGMKALSNRMFCITTVALLLFTLYTSLICQSPIVNNGKSVVYFIALYLLGTMLGRLKVPEVIHLRSLAFGGYFVAHCCCPNISCSDGIAEIS